MIHGSVGWLFQGLQPGLRGRPLELRRGRCAGCLRHCGLALVLYVGLLVLTWFGFTNVPSGFIPAQDKGNLFCYLQLPDGASLQRTRGRQPARAWQLIKETPGVACVSEFAGLSLVNLGNSANASSMFIRLEPFEERVKEGLTRTAIIAQPANAALPRPTSRTPMIGVFGPPPVDGLGTLGGFKLQVEDRSAAGYPALQAATDQRSRRQHRTRTLSRRIDHFPRRRAANIPGR